MLEMMIDLETLDTRPSAIVLSIGAVVWQSVMEDHFIPDGTSRTQKKLGYEIVDRWMRVPRIDEQTKLRTMSESTLMWWQNQTSMAQQEAFNPVRLSARATLQEFMQWTTGFNTKITRFWASPSTFDFPIMESYADQFEMPLPWSYRQKYDVRTAVNEASYSADDHILIRGPLVGVPHTPVFDCEWQIDLLTGARRKAGRRAAG